MKMALIDAMEYRLDVLIFVISGFVLPLVLLSVWLALIASGGKSPLSSGQMVQYYLFVMIIELWTLSWSAEYRARDIRDGKVSMFLVKPYSYFLDDLYQNIAQKMLKTLYFMPVLFVIAYFLKMPIPSLSLAEWLLFLVSWLFAFGINFLMHFCIGISAFWIDENKSILEFTDLFYFFLSGQLFPLIALPVFLRNLSDILPFRYMLSFPLEILQHSVNGINILFAFTMQTGWFVALLLLYFILWKKGVRRYSAVG